MKFYNSALKRDLPPPPRASGQPGSRSCRAPFLFSGYFVPFVSNLGQAEWLPQKVVAGWKGILPSTRQRSKNTRSHCGLQEAWPLSTQKRFGNLPWRRWELLMCALTPGWAELSGSMEWGRSYTLSVCCCPEDGKRMKNHHLSCIHWLTRYLSPL